MLHTFHEIINALGVFISLINWWAVTSLIESLLAFGASWLDYKTACKMAHEKTYLPPVPTSSRRRNPRQQTWIRRRKHKSLSK